jgi:hypothetical protein
MMILLLLVLIFGVLFLVPTVLGIVRAAQNGDTPWLIAILVGWIVGAGWIVALVYLSRVDPPARRLAGASSSPPGLLPPAQPAAWHADPTGRFDQRYWDGRRWTEHVSRGGVPTTDPL